MVGINWGYSRGRTPIYLECVADVQVRMEGFMTAVVLPVFLLL